MSANAQYQPPQWGTPERPLAWSVTGHTEDFDDCGTAQFELATAGRKLTIEILAGDYQSVKDAGQLIGAAPDLLAAARAEALDRAHDAFSDLHEDPEAGDDAYRNAARDLLLALCDHHAARVAAIAKAEGAK